MESINSPAPKFSKSAFTPLLISLLGIVSTAVAIALYHFIVVKYCIRRRQRRRSITGGLSGPPQAGVEKKVLETIPVLAYSVTKRALFRVDQTECAVCLGDLDEGEMVRLLPNCGHAFHVPCVDQWFMGRTSCPLCRSPVVPPAVPLPPECIEIRPPSTRDDDGENDRTVGGRVEGCASAGHSRQGLLQHCASVVLVPERREPPHLATGLKRSVSMDLSFLVIEVEGDDIDERERGCSSSTSSLSSKLLRSFSRLRMGKGGTASGIILPY